MDKKLSLLLGILAGLFLISLNFFNIYEMFDDSGIVWAILHVIFTILSAIGLIAIVLCSITLIMDAFKIIIRKRD